MRDNDLDDYEDGDNKDDSCFPFCTLSDEELLEGISANRCIDDGDEEDKNDENRFPFRSLSDEELRELLEIEEGDDDDEGESHDDEDEDDEDEDDEDEDDDEDSDDDDDDDEDNENDTDDYDEDEENYDVVLQDLFIQACLRLARNDETLVQLIDDWPETQFSWDRYDFLLLGRSLVGNTHLQSLSVCPGPYFDWDLEKVVHVLCEGVAQSNLHSLTLADAFLQETHLETIAECSSLRTLNLSTIHTDLNVLVNLFLKGPTSELDCPNRCCLTHLSLNESYFDDKNMLNLSSALSSNKVLLSLNLDDNQITM